MKTILRKIAHNLGATPFDPGFAALFTNPFFHARRALARSIREFSGQFSGRLLDVGCGQKPYRGFFDAVEYIGLELDTAENRVQKKADVYYDGSTMPFPDASFDGIICNQVFEHVFRPGEFLGELNRVLKRDGLLLLTVPFVWDEHEQPVDFGRYTSFGLKYILQSHGFSVVEFRKTNADLRVILQLFNAYVYKASMRLGRIGYYLAMAFLMVPCNILGFALGPILPRNPDLFLDSVVLARKVDA